MPRSSEFDPKFRDEVMAEPGGEKIVHCFSCGTCTASCPISWVNEGYNPRRIIRMVAIGMREEVLSSPFIWFCSACDLCYRRCPQGVRISDLMKALRNIAIREGYEPPGPVAAVSEELCSGCGVCVMACPYEALKLEPISGNEHLVARVDKFLCMNCGICAAACPPGAITIEGFANEEIISQMRADNWLSEGPRPRVLVFICEWCLRAESERALLSQYSPNIRVIEVPCSGRVDPQFVLYALEAGADGVLVVGCQTGECHYKRGDYIRESRMSLLRTLFTQMGFADKRVRFEQIGSSDRGKFPHLVEEMVAELRDRGRG